MVTEDFDLVILLIKGSTLRDCHERRTGGRNVSDGGRTCSRDHDVGGTQRGPGVVDVPVHEDAIAMIKRQRRRCGRIAEDMPMHVRDRSSLGERR
jgi:hypothetical protein